MTITSIDTPSQTASSAKMDLSVSSSDASARAESSEFGQIMSGVMQSCAESAGLTTGQDVAVQFALQPGFPGSFGGHLSASLGGDFLKAVNLGPNMNVITSEATVPDEQSLEAFARSQGLDETAVQWLMGSHPITPVAPPMTMTEPASALSQTTMLGAINANSSTVASGEWPVKESLGQTLAANPAAIAAPISAVNPAVNPAVTPSGSLNDNHNGQVNASKTDQPLLPNALSAAALWAMTQATEKARVTPPQTQEDPAEAAKAQINLMASSAPAAFWLLRNPLTVAPGKEAAAQSPDLSLSEIDLTQTATPELLESLTQALSEGAAPDTFAAANDQATPLSGHSGQRMEAAAAARQNTPNSDTSAQAPDSGNAQRTENTQNLAEKMGQAVGQRILSEIEKGQWHLKLSLRPATLGHIEVEMRMRSGELDAVFTAPQALTRELLQEGMSKLKDTLSQMGMDVASMQVADGQSQKRGGESTPEQMSKSAKTNSDDPKSSLSSVQAPVSRMKMGQDGWDVMV